MRIELNKYRDKRVINIKRNFAGKIKYPSLERIDLGCVYRTDKFKKKKKNISSIKSNNNLGFSYVIKNLDGCEYS